MFKSLNPAYSYFSAIWALSTMMLSYNIPAKFTWKSTGDREMRGAPRRSRTSCGVCRWRCRIDLVDAFFFFFLPPSPPKLINNKAKQTNARSPSPGFQTRCSFVSCGSALIHPCLPVHSAPARLRPLPATGGNSSKEGSAGLWGLTGCRGEKVFFFSFLNS